LTYTLKKENALYKEFTENQADTVITDLEDCVKYLKIAIRILKKHPLILEEYKKEVSSLKNEPASPVIVVEQNDIQPSSK
jgi:hypothetical protein